MGMFAKRKGRAGEQEVCRLLKAGLGDLGAFERNSMQAHAIEGMSQKDILTNLPLAIEVKRTEAKLYRQWLEQAREQNDPGNFPVLAHRSNGEPWRFVMELSIAEFFRFVRALTFYQKHGEPGLREAIANANKAIDQINAGPIALEDLSSGE
jgi:hypothetical protein